MKSIKAALKGDNIRKHINNDRMIEESQSNTNKCKKGTKTNICRDTASGYKCEFYSECFKKGM